MSVYTSLSEYLEARERYKQTPYRLNNEGGFFFVKGEWIPENIYYQHNSIPVYQRPQPENPDSTFIYAGVPPTKRSK